MKPVNETAALLSLARACERNRLACIRYVDANGSETQREVAVLGLGWRRDGWVFFGLCRIRAAYRLFRLDRVVEIRLARRAPMVPDTGFDARAFASGEVFERSGDGRRATVRLIPETAPLSGVLFPSALVEHLPGGERLCHLRVSSIPALAELLVTLGDAAVPIRPPELVRLVRLMKLEIGQPPSTRKSGSLRVHGELGS